MEQAKWYFILMHNPRWKYCGTCMRLRKRSEFYANVLADLLRNDGFGRVKTDWRNADLLFFCGQKKLNKVIEEAHLLGLEDELLIFERSK